MQLLTLQMLEVRVDAEGLPTSQFVVLWVFLHTPLMWFQLRKCVDLLISRCPLFFSSTLYSRLAQVRTEISHRNFASMRPSPSPHFFGSDL